MFDKKKATEQQRAVIWWAAAVALTVGTFVLTRRAVVGDEPDWAVTLNATAFLVSFLVCLVVTVFMTVRLRQTR